MKYKIIFLSLIFAMRAFPQSDAYEPNNDFVSAYSLSAGDSVVKNAITTGGLDSINSNGDPDFYKVTLADGMLTTISTFSCLTNPDSIALYVKVLPQIQVYDPLKNYVASGYGKLSFKNMQSGAYYCRISCNINQSYKYGLSIRQGNCNITILSPNGGESYSAEQNVTISWAKEGYIPYLLLHYSVDNGISWTRIWEANLTDSSRSFLWTVPHLKQRTDLALIKITAADIQNPPSDVSNGTFTIQAAPTDAYEPNNDFASAYPIAIGDSVVKNAMVFSDDSMFMDTLNMDTLNSDVDFFKVTLSAGKLVIISSIPWVPVSGDTNSYGGASPIIEAYDASKNLISQGLASLSCKIMESGAYYCKIYPAFSGSWTNYGLSIKSVTVLSSQKSALDTAAMQNTGDSAYTAQLIADTTKLNILLTLKKKVNGSIMTAVLAPDELAPAMDTKVKAISISADSAFSSSIKTTDIAIPYDTSVLNGAPQTSLMVMWLNGSSNQWTAVSSSIDTVKHQIIAHTTHFSIYGVFIKSNTAIGSLAAMPVPAYGIKANFLLKKQSIAVHFNVPTATVAELALYNVQGKCVKKTIAAAGSGNSTMLWHLGGLGNGKYFLSLKGGKYYTKEAILIMK